jgi:outer membrane receptor protein involved in Fe transport
MQLETNTPTELGGGRSATNAGEQRTRGVEFDLIWAATERLRVGLNGAIMDGLMVNYPGAGCTDYEFENAASGPCLTAAESQAQFGTTAFQGTIDRTGYPAPRTPDWKFVLDFEYWYPIFDQYKVSFSSKTTLSDGWIQNVRNFDQARTYDKRYIANLNLGFGQQDDTWDLTFWIRNVLGRSEALKYFPEFDPPRTFSLFTGSGQYGIIDTDTTPRDYTTYGVQFTYKYN